MFKLMFLLTTCDLSKLLLWYASHKSFQPTEHLRYTLCVKQIPLWFSDQCLDLNQTIADQMRSQSIIYLFEYQLFELLGLSLLNIENLVHEPNLQQFLGSDSLTHNKGLICFADS